MRILLTSGGTRVPIDRVRHIRNMSRGTFGSKIGTELLRMGEKLTFLRAVESKSPFTTFLDLNSISVFSAFKQVLNLSIKKLRYRKLYSELQYKTFDDYASILERYLKETPPDVTILAAAVSDYGVANYVDKKIRSGSDLAIQLKALEKLIEKVKLWCPTTSLVGFKLLVDSTQEELISAARKSCINNGCDFVVANDLRDIQNDDHQIIVVTPNSETIYYQRQCNLAEIVAKKSVELRKS